MQLQIRSRPRRTCGQGLRPEPRSKLKTPARHVLHRRNFNKLGEPAGKGGARATDFLRQPVEGPRLCRPAMDQTECRTDVRIAKSGEPVARTLWETLDVAS
jgi:hypothetical protein